VSCLIRAACGFQWNSRVVLDLYPYRGTNSREFHFQNWPSYRTANLMKWPTCGTANWGKSPAVWLYVWGVRERKAEERRKAQLPSPASKHEGAGSRRVLPPRSLRGVDAKWHRGRAGRPTGSPGSGNEQRLGEVRAIPGLRIETGGTHRLFENRVGSSWTGATRQQRDIGRRRVCHTVPKGR